MKLHQLKVKAKASRKRVGRGISAGQGKTAGRGTKGQGARSGAQLRPTFEGGQNPLIMRLPKQRGFHSHRLQAQLIKTGQLNRFKANQAVGPTELLAAGLARLDKPIRVVKAGDLSKSIKLEIHGANQSARQAVTGAGGSLKLIDFKPVKPRSSKTKPKAEPKES